MSLTVFCVWKVLTSYNDINNNQWCDSLMAKSFACRYSSWTSQTLAERLRCSCFNDSKLYNLSQWTNTVDQARLKVVKAPHASVWLNAPPIECVTLRLSDEEIQTAVGFTSTCELHQYVCSFQVDAGSPHGLSCRKSAPRLVWYSLFNDILWRAIKKMKVTTCNETTGLSPTDGRLLNGAT